MVFGHDIQYLVHKAFLDIKPRSAFIAFFHLAFRGEKKSFTKVVTLPIMPHLSDQGLGDGEVLPLRRCEPFSVRFAGLILLFLVQYYLFYYFYHWKTSTL